jgi:hypothetical protein
VCPGNLAVPWQHDRLFAALPHCRIAAWRRKTLAAFAFQFAYKLHKSLKYM